MPTKRLQILNRECVGLAGVRAFHIDNLDDFFWHPRQRPFAAGFEQDLVVGVQKLFHQRDNIALLQHGFAAGDFDEAALGAQASYFAEYFLRDSFCCRRRS